MRIQRFDIFQDSPKVLYHAAALIKLYRVTYSRAVGSFFIVEQGWGGEMSKMAATMVGRRWNIEKKTDWLKHAKAAPKNEIWTKI